jgi:hypothetical protein
MLPLATSNHERRRAHTHDDFRPNQKLPSLLGDDIFYVFNQWLR